MAIKIGFDESIREQVVKSPSARGANTHSQACRQMGALMSFDEVTNGNCQIF